MQILKRRQRIANSLRSRAGWRLERAIERRQRKSRLIRHTNETTPPPPISTGTDIDGGGCGYIEAH